MSFQYELGEAELVTILEALRHYQRHLMQGGERISLVRGGEDSEEELETEEGIDNLCESLNCANRILVES